MLRLGGHAVVIGGSIAGLMTARLLSDFFDQVTVIEQSVQLFINPFHRATTSMACCRADIKYSVHCFQDLRKTCEASAPCS
jgi:hypothetical protein